MNEKHKYRLVLCGHKAIEAGAVCLMLMVRGDLVTITLAHLAIASRTGLLAVVPALGVTCTKYARYFSNRWTSSLFLGISTFLADAVVHSSRNPGGYTEAALTGLGACLFSIILSFTPIGKRIDGLLESFSFPHNEIPEVDDYE